MLPLTKARIYSRLLQLCISIADSLDTLSNKIIANSQGYWLTIMKDGKRELYCDEAIIKEVDHNHWYVTLTALGGKVYYSKEGPLEEIKDDIEAAIRIIKEGKANSVAASNSNVKEQDIKIDLTSSSINTPTDPEGLF